MTEAELDTLAEKIAAKVDHTVCPLGMDADAVEAAQMLGRAQHNVQCKDGDYVVLLRFGKESNSMIIRFVRLILLGVVLATLLILGPALMDNLARFAR